ncbi:MAG: glucokinase [Hyphomicrobiales bacterium]|nr:glucokinase [Hyphomicrobiales bacterium]
MPDTSEKKSNGSHGALELPSVVIDSYNLELREKDGFIGDRASKRAFHEILEDWRDRIRKVDDDPLGDVPGEEMGKKKLDDVLLNGDAEAAGILHGAIEDFAQEFAAVTRRFLRAKGWQNTQRIVVGGGFRESRIGERALGRAAILLKASGVAIDIVPIRNHPDEAGLLGAGHLMPAWTLTGHDAILAVDIGGSNIRAGVVLLNLKQAPDLSKAKVWNSELWRHADDSPKRDEAVQRLVGMLEGMIAKAAKEKISLAPLIGIGCPGVIDPDGSIDRGGQNLPGGNWESGRFNLPAELRKAIPLIGDHETMVVMHNDAVVQGLSEVPFMSDVEHWGVLTIGTGLGNARFTNRDKPKPMNKNGSDKEDKSDKKEKKKG